MINFMVNLAGSQGGQIFGYILFLDMSVRVFPDQIISISESAIYSVSESADSISWSPPQGKWASHNVLRT